jgi:alpha-L-fucosidase
LYETKYPVDDWEYDKLKKVSEPVYTAEDIVFTSKGDTLYAVCLAWPKEKVLIKSLGTDTLPDIKILGVSMLGVEEDLKWDLSEDGLIIFTPKEKPCGYAFVFKVDLNNSN